MDMVDRGEKHTHAWVAAGALFFDGAGRVMLVRPTYKDHRDIPGGYVEVGETPRRACEREVLEELGLRVDMGPLLVVDWAPHPAEGDKLLFVFDGGQLAASQVDRIQLQPDELAEYDFYAVDELARVLIPRLERRLSAAARARSEGRTLYLENGREAPAVGITVGINQS